MPQPIPAANGSAAKTNGRHVAAAVPAPPDAIESADRVLAEIQARSPAARRPLSAVELADRERFAETCG